MPYDSDIWAWAFFGSVLFSAIFFIIREDIIRMREDKKDKEILKTAEEIRNELH